MILKLSTKRRECHFRSPSTCNSSPNACQSKKYSSFHLFSQPISANACTCTFRRFQTLGFECTLYNKPPHVPPPSTFLPSKIETKLAYCASSVQARACMASVPRNISHNIITPCPRGICHDGGFRRHRLSTKTIARVHVVSTYGWHACASFSA